MMVAMPAANTSVIAASWVRRWKLVAKYAGSITEIQHGASRATTPPRNAVITVPDNSSWLMNAAIPSTRARELAYEGG